MLLKDCSILQGKFAPSFIADNGRMLFFKTKNTRVSLWPQAATNLHVNGHTFQTQKSIVHCGKGSQQLSCVCRTQLGLGAINDNNWPVYTFLHPWHIQLTGTIRKQWVEHRCWRMHTVLERKKERKQRREVWVVNYLPGYKKGKHWWNRTQGSFQKEQESKIELGVYDRPARLHLSKNRNLVIIYGASRETNFWDINGRRSFPSSDEPVHPTWISSMVAKELAILIMKGDLK